MGGCPPAVGCWGEVLWAPPGPGWGLYCSWGAGAECPRGAVSVSVPPGPGAAPGAAPAAEEQMLGWSWAVQRGEPPVGTLGAPLGVGASPPGGWLAPGWVPLLLEPWAVGCLWCEPPWVCVWGVPRVCPPARSPLCWVQGGSGHPVRGSFILQVLLVAEQRSRVLGDWRLPVQVCAVPPQWYWGAQGQGVVVGGVSSSAGWPGAALGVDAQLAAVGGCWGSTGWAPSGWGESGPRLPCDVPCRSPMAGCVGWGPPQ